MFELGKCLDFINIEFEYKLIFSILTYLLNIEKINSVCSLAYLLYELGKLHTIIKHIHIRKKLCTCPDQQQQRGGVKHIKLFFYRFLSFIDISKISVFLRVVVRLVES